MANKSYPGQIFSDLVSGNLFQADQITGPYICVVGTASSGPSYKLKRISSEAEAVQIFEADNPQPNSAFLKDISLALQEGGDAITLYAMRIGGSQGSVTFAQASGGTLKIQPAYEDAEAFDKYRIILGESEITPSSQRVIVYDIEEQVVVFDTDFIIVPDLGLVKVTISSDWSGFHQFGFDSDLQPQFEGSLAGPSLTALAAAPGTYFDGNHYTATNSAGSETVTKSEEVSPTDGSNLSRPAYYACLEKAYSLIATRYMDYIVPSGVHFDAPNITDTEDGRDQTHSVAVDVYSSATIDWSDPSTIQGDPTKDILGYVWQYKYKAQKYVFMSHDSSYFTSSDTITVENIASFNGDDTKLVATTSGDLKSKIYWDGTNYHKIQEILIQVKSDAAVTGDTAEVTKSFNSTTGVLTLVVAYNQGTNNCFPAVVNTALAATDEIASSVFTDGAGGALDQSATNYLKDNNATFNTGPQDSTSVSGQWEPGKTWLSHNEMVGDAIPNKVWSKLIDDGSNTQLREVNFGHQLASFCYYASNSYHMCLGFISFSQPEGKTKVELGEYYGAPPEYQGWAGSLGNEALKTVGEGILSNKFLAGSFGYRGKVLRGGTSSQGLAYGGLICTKGLGLPNKEPYGINQGDEKLDKNKAPVDIGRHLVVSASWPICAFDFLNQSSNNTGIGASHSICALLAARIFVTPVNQEPFGVVNGAVRSGIAVTSNESDIILEGYGADLNDARIVVLHRSSQGTNYIVNMTTAAHWRDDYKRISSIRCVSRVVNGLRNLASRYIGSSFSSAMVTSLQSAINGYLKSERDVGVHQGAVARISYSRRDRINGNMKIILRMVPPFALETITIEVSVSADE